ncbi:hypothetical protein GQ44DRAFT_706836 [Phaeosphaeriaceae sp. PMI808]|nr:hypothetical protein GQ44DRAFT_706836 [Phaeosphaeriaceae sp. PMI808]
MDQPTSIESSPSTTPQHTPNGTDSLHNPYKRIASRRAIACVTCAKAKTKCDKLVCLLLPPLFHEN